MGVPNRGPELQAVCYTLLVSSVIAVGLRIYVRTRMVKNFGMDDWTMCAALISIGITLLRITNRKMDIWILYGTMAITLCTGIVFFFVTLFQCWPISYFWNTNQDGKCVSPDVIIALTYLYSVFSVISDFTCAILPIFLISKLNMGKKTKLAVIPLFAMACVLVTPHYSFVPQLTPYRASSAVVVRFAFVKDFKNPDFLWATVDIAIWSATEQGLAITAGSLATLRPLLRLLGRKLGITTSGRSELKDTDQRTGTGLGQFGPSRATNSGNKKSDLFGLATFAREDDLNGHGRDCEAAYAGKDHFGRPSAERTVVSTWDSRRGTGNSSEEELTPGLRPKSSGAVKVTTTFKVEEDRI
ncbi:hypothetical protein ACHAPD_005434 [Fusarium lateritium]